ncbi:protein gamma response 1 isoform X3 [Fagus crenata]
MEGHLQNSPKQEHPVYIEDEEHVLGLGTKLVATIEEAKDRIFQIEHVFCSQIFPNFQLKSESLQKIYSQGKKAAEDAWKEKENELILQIERLQREKQQALEENQSLKLEMEKPSKEQEEKRNKLYAKLGCQQIEIYELESELERKKKEVDEGMEFQNRLIQLIHEKASDIVNKGKQLKQYEKKTNEFHAKVNDLEKKVDELQDELRRKNEKVVEGKELEQNLLKEIGRLNSKISDDYQLSRANEKEKKLLTVTLEHFKDKAGSLREELQKKTDEVEEGRKLQAQLQQQIDLDNTEISNNKQQLEEYEKEKNLQKEKIIGLKLKINELMVNYGGKSSEVAEGRDSITSTNIGNKVSDSSEAPCDTDEVNGFCFSGSSYDEEGAKLIQASSSDSPTSNLGNKVSDISGAPYDTDEVNNICFNESLNDKEGQKLIQTPSFDSPTSSFPMASNSPSNVKSASLAGTKRPASCWREKWSRQCLVKKVDELQCVLRRKKQKVAEGEELAQIFLKKTDLLLSEISDNLQLLSDNKEEKKLLMAKLERLEYNAGGLQQELQRKSHEVEKGRKIHYHLLQQIDSTNIEMSKNQLQKEKCEKEKKLLVDKLEVQVKIMEQGAMRYYKPVKFG